MIVVLAVAGWIQPMCAGSPAGITDSLPGDTGSSDHFSWMWSDLWSSRTAHCMRSPLRWHNIEDITSDVRISPIFHSVIVRFRLGLVRQVGAGIWNRRNFATCDSDQAECGGDKLTGKLHHMKLLVTTLLHDIIQSFDKLHCFVHIRMAKPNNYRQYLVVLAVLIILRECCRTCVEHIAGAVLWSIVEADAGRWANHVEVTLHRTRCERNGAQRCVGGRRRSTHEHTVAHERYKLTNSVSDHRP